MRGALTSAVWICLEPETARRQSGRSAKLNALRGRCYVTIKWRLQGVRGLGPIRSEERRVNCNCHDLEAERCGGGCKTLIIGGLVIAGACLAGPGGAAVGGLVGAGAM